MRAVCVMLAVALCGGASAQEVTAPAAEACVAPVAPPAWEPGPAPEMPQPPKCLNLEKRTSSCSTTTFNGYNAKIAEHNAQLKARIDGFNAYGRALSAYMRAANDYTNCQSDRANALIAADEQ